MTKPLSQKRSLVGWPKGKKKIWDDIIKITNGTGMKSDISPTTRRVSAEFSENVPRFMWNSKSTYTYDIVEQELRDNYGYNFEKDDIFSQLQQAEKDRFGEEETETRKPTEDEIRRSIEEQVQPLMNEGEDLEAFFDRMEGEARETGWGDDVNGYIDQQLEIKKKPTEPVGGEEPPEFFKLEPKFSTRDIRAELGTLSEEILERMAKGRLSDLPKYVSEQLPSARIFDQSMRDQIDQKLAKSSLDVRTASPSDRPSAVENRSRPRNRCIPHTRPR